LNGISRYVTLSIFAFLVVWFVNFSFPVFASEKYSPTVQATYPSARIQPNTNVTISANVTDKFGTIRNATLSYSVDYGLNWVDLPMNLTWGDRSNGTYSGVIPSQPENSTTKYRLSIMDDLGYSYTHSGNYSNYDLKEDVKPPVISSVFVKNNINPSTVSRATVSPGQNASVQANVTDDLSGVKNVSLIYSTMTPTKNTSVPMSLSSGNFLNGSYNGQIMAFNAKTIVSYFVKACDYAGNCNKPLSHHYKYSVANILPPSIIIGFNTRISNLDPSNLTAKIKITGDIQNAKSVNQSLVLGKNIEGIGLDIHNFTTSTGHFYIPLNSSNEIVAQSIDPLYGDQSRYPFDYYNASLLVAIPIKNLTTKQFSENPPQLDRLQGASWNAMFPEVIRIDKQHQYPVLQGLRNDCKEIVGMEGSPYLCPVGSAKDYNYTFMNVNMKFIRNYNSIGAIIAPIIGIFYLLGAIFILTGDQLGNRLTLALSVFALIFTLPQFVKDLKPLTSTPTVADVLIGIIIVAAIGYTVSSVIYSVIRTRSRRFIDRIAFIVIAGIAFYVLVNYPLDIGLWLIPVVILGLGYGLIIQAVRSKKDHKKRINMRIDQF